MLFPALVFVITGPPFVSCLLNCQLQVDCHLFNSRLTCVFFNDTTSEGYCDCQPGFHRVTKATLPQEVVCLRKTRGEDCFSNNHCIANLMCHPFERSCSCPDNDLLFSTDRNFCYRPRDGDRYEPCISDSNCLAGLTCSANMTFAEVLISYCWGKSSTTFLQPSHLLLVYCVILAAMKAIPYLHDGPSSL